MPPYLDSIWVLEIQSQVLMLAQQATEPSPQALKVHFRQLSLCELFGSLEDLTHGTVV